MEHEQALSILSSAIETARACETEAQALDAPIAALSRGEPCPPAQFAALLARQQTVYRRMSGHTLLVATMLLESSPLSRPLPMWRRVWLAITDRRR